MSLQSLAVRLLRHRTGAALVEFALALPLLLSLLMGMLCYAQYIWIAHAAQQIANDAARAAVAGLDQAEREAIAKNVLARMLPAMPEIRKDRAAITVEDRQGYLVTRVSVDARGTTLLYNGFVPMPNPLIYRWAVVRLEHGA